MFPAAWRLTERNQINMDKILLLTTGGTIMSEPSDRGYTPTLSGPEITKYLGPIRGDVEVQTKNILQLDSSNIQPEEWQLIARSIDDSFRQFDGVVVTHGTDTMAYTASMLSYMLRNIPVPIVLTGSQLPIWHPLSDAPGNLACAFAMAANRRPGVFVAFDHAVILGTRAVKVRTTGFHAFESINYPYVGTIDSNGLVVNDSVLPNASGAYTLSDRLETKVALMKIVPGFNPELLERLLDMKYRGVVVEAFGIGGMHFIRRNLVEELGKLVKNGISVVVCSQCLYEKSDFSVYETGRGALENGVIPGQDMTTEAAITKLMWVLGQTDEPDAIRRTFTMNIAGEIFE